MKETSNAHPTRNALRAPRGYFTICRMISAIALAAAVTAARDCNAGVLLDIYNKATTTEASGEVAGYLAKAADQNVETQKRLYLPHLSVLDRELWVTQDVVDSGNPVFPAGSSSYGSNHLTVELDQPIYDPTIGPAIEASRDRKLAVHARGDLVANEQARQIVEGFLQAARFQGLIQSSNRAIARLEEELTAVTRSYKAGVASVTDVQSVNLSLAGLKRERNNYTQQLFYGLAKLGVSEEVFKSAWVHLAPGADVAASRLAAGSKSADMGGGNHAEMDILRAEASELGNKASAADRRSWPVLSLYSEYNIDADSGSVFGGPVNVRTFGAGVAVKWDIFDRGQSLSEAKELGYQKLAKEAELKELMIQKSRSSASGQELLDQSSRSVNELADLVKQYKGLMEASTRSYQAGQESYLNSISAYLAYESTVREWINAQNDLLVSQVSVYALSSGWNAGLVKKVDALFVVSKK